MNQKAYLTDLDGTLLRSDATLSAYTVDTVTEMLRLGVPISYSTARSFRSACQVVSQIPWSHPEVLYNGALLYDPIERQVLGGNWLDAEFSNAILELGRSHHLLPLLFALTPEDEEAVLHEPLVRPGDRQFYASRPNDPRFRELRHLNTPDDYKTLILTYIGLYEELEPFRVHLTETFGSMVHMHMMEDVYLKPHYFLEVSHAKANKKEGLYMWAKQVGVEPADITAFGDNLNDLGMFEAAGTGIAVSNARDQLKAIATLTIGSHEQDAVAQYLRSHALQAYSTLGA